ncbi:PREDICTED: zinc-activated ligand-gated ion channel-like isoform X2 [Cyprinodon variegatus]|uniref:zinc-activated ligand-gated ion channel-like isoform X2 n=1 Tax=Cyprinodon variegatus TaxID=28743 RepID=UPI0007426F5E|nr:PREDICTED: zinc-activated ligand-gated ion channel-like isoform X2 [Cyprinodon variegatus]
MLALCKDHTAQQRNMESAVVLLSLLITGFAQTENMCTDRRCLAQMLISKEYLSSPQSENCTMLVEVPIIRYQTLSVNMKELHVKSRLEADIKWIDPELAWNTSIYPFERVILPVNKVWTPDIAIENGESTMQHHSLDLLVHSNGTVQHKVVVLATVECEINLFNYPFAFDKCPVGIKSTPPDECGIVVDVNTVTLGSTSHGDWETEEVKLEKKREDRNYISVYLRIRVTNPFITLLLPTYLIMIADIVSCALPLQGGERNSFKVTLVLSFTMFLNILTDVLPGDSKCSPVIRIHFCVCQVLMMISTLVSMLLTRVSQDGFFLFTFSFSRCSRQNAGGNEENDEAEAKGDISIIQHDVSQDSLMHNMIVKFLEAFDTKQQETERRQQLADKLDKICFWFYLVVTFAYLAAMTYVMVRYECIVDHFTFWE